MKAIIFNETGRWTEKLLLGDTIINEPNENEVQINIRARPINPSDEMFIAGAYRQKPELPQIAGLEGAGVIERVGKNLDACLLGKHVAFRAKGTWAEKINLPNDAFQLVPPTIPFEIACQLSLNSLTAIALLERAGLRESQWLLLTAAHSAVSKQIIQLAKAKNIRVIALVRKDEQRIELLRLGADAVLNSENGDLETQIMDITLSGANAILDAVGGPLGAVLFNVAAPSGKLVLYGQLSPENTSFAYGTVIYKNLIIEGFGIDHWLGSKTKNERDLIWQNLLSAVTNNALKLSWDKSFDVRDANDAIRYYKETGAKVVLL